MTLCRTRFERVAIRATGHGQELDDGEQDDRRTHTDQAVAGGPHPEVATADGVGAVGVASRHPIKMKP
jgi:hypothetical protein